MQSNQFEERPEETLRQLYEAYEGRLYKVAYAILQDIGQAEDAVQDTFVKVVPYLAKIREFTQEQTWYFLQTITKNQAINRYRKNNRERKLFQQTQSELMIEEEKLFSTNDVENQLYLSQILEGLNAADREIIKYRCYYDLSYREIAKCLNVSTVAAMKRFERAKERVQKLVGGESYVI